MRVAIEDQIAAGILVCERCASWPTAQHPRASEITSGLAAGQPFTDGRSRLRCRGWDNADTEWHRVGVVGHILFPQKHENRSSA